MNILHLKYALEVEKTASITKAAENLFMGQPNLSRSIKELEESIGVKIFKRTAKGIVPTEQGEELLQEAKIILYKINNFGIAYKKDEEKRLFLRISAPRIRYITKAFAKTIKELENDKGYDGYFVENKPDEAIDSLSRGDHKLAILRVEEKNLENLTAFLCHRGLKHEEVLRCTAKILMAKKYAEKDEYTLEEFEKFTEIYFGGIYYPKSTNKGLYAEYALARKKRIKVYDRSCAGEFLLEIPNAYVYTTDIYEDITVNRPFKIVNVDGLEPTKYVDLVVWSKAHELTVEEECFIKNLKSVENVDKL